MLEQQQVWLVHGLQDLYRRASEGEGWPGEPLKPEPNGHLLTRLGALDQTKGEHFEENTEAMQQDLWRRSAGYMQRQESSDGSSDSAHSPLMGTRFGDIFARHQAPLTPPGYSPTVSMHPAIVKTESQLQLPFANMSIPGVVDPVALQEPLQWPPQNSMSAFDEMDFMATPGYSNPMFDEQPITPSPMFSRQLQMSCMPTFIDPSDDIQQFLNPNTEITSI
jgi:hypothetical protein